MLKLHQENVAKKFNIGKTRIKICTDYCVNDPVEVKEILNIIAEKSLPSIDDSSQQNIC